MSSQPVTSSTDIGRTDAPVVLHYGQIPTSVLDELARCRVAIVAPCGDHRIPLRPPFPPEAVPCPMCHALAEGVTA